MSLPDELRELISRYLAVLQQHPAHQLIPYYREQIYRFFRVGDSAYSQKVLAWIQILSAESVKAAGQSLLPEDYKPEQYIRLAKKVVQKEIAQDKATEVLYELYDKRADVSLEVAPQKLVDAYNAFFAAVQSLEWSLQDPGNVDFDLSEDDEDWLDPENDAALWAAAVCAGEVWGDHYDPARGLTFWQWWLEQVIPEAWKVATEA